MSSINVLILTIQYEMEAQYQEKSMLTNLFVEHKFLGWTGLFMIFLSICSVFYFTVSIWEEEENHDDIIR